MFSHRYLWFYLCIFTTYASALAPSEDTPLDQIVSCVYPMSGQYALLPRILFYVSLIFASTVRRSGWFSNVVLGLAMSYSTTAFVHIIVIYATHGWTPPILDLDALGTFMIGTASVSMYPALAILRQSKYNSVAVQRLVGSWWYIMFFLSSMARLLLSQFMHPRKNSNSEVACYLPDNTLLTSLAQLNGARDLECIYDCFLTRKSVLKTQDEVTVMWGAPMKDEMGNWGIVVGGICSGLMLILGSNIHTYPRVIKWLDTMLLKPVYAVHNEEKVKRAILTPVVCICLISMAPWVIMIEYSLRNILVEEMSFAIGQWAPWVAALLAIIGGAIYHQLEETESGEELLKPADDSLDGYVMAGALMDDFPASGRKEDTTKSDQSSRLLDEIDLGTYRITPEPG
ncbi:hypothetical protein V491_09172 [Pseudogymnoascus sp. VKM F-3775]|nr:hypothetical protein V491_09172 [Pseudogymnoascus sp. VKM F-3775]